MLSPEGVGVLAVTAASGPALELGWALEGKLELTPGSEAGLEPGWELELAPGVGVITTSVVES